MNLGSRISSLASSISGGTQPVTMPCYDSYETALRASTSYEDPRLIEIVSKMTERYREALQQESGLVRDPQVAMRMFVFSFVEPQKKLDVLELGGACGATFFELNALLDGRIRNWAIVETPRMVATARQLATPPALSFHTDLRAACEALQQRDMLAAFGVLQYTPDPLVMLDHLVTLGFEYFYLARTLVHVNSEFQNGTIFTRQTTNLAAHGPGAMPTELQDGESSQPMTIVGLDKVLTTISIDYQLVCRFHESETRTLRIGERNVLVRDIGFLAKRRARP